MKINGPGGCWNEHRYTWNLFNIPCFFGGLFHPPKERPISNQNKGHQRVPGIYLVYIYIYICF